MIRVTQVNIEDVFKIAYYLFQVCFTEIKTICFANSINQFYKVCFSPCPCYFCLRKARRLSCLLFVYFCNFLIQINSQHFVCYYFCNFKIANRRKIRVSFKIKCFHCHLNILFSSQKKVLIQMRTSRTVVFIEINVLIVEIL